MAALTGKQGFFYRNRYLLLAFFIPFFLMIYTFAAAGFYPFGGNQIAVIDMYHQYFPFLNEFHHKLLTGGSFLYTWNGGLGTNFISLMAYYTASPLYLLTALVPAAYLMEAMTMLVIIKISLAGMFMALFLRGVHGKCNLGTVAFAVLYALCAYMLGYYWCIMWLDVVALLPLCMLGLYCLVNKGSFRLYTISLAVIMLTNYYIGGMACIFTLFYYPVLYFSQKREGGLRLFLQTTGKAILCSLIGLLMAAAILVPTFLSMQNTYYINSQMPQATLFNNPILSVLTNLLPDMPLTVRDGLPNIYCGLLSVILLVFFILCKSIPLRKKLLSLGLLAFLILSFNWNKLDFMWHGFHYPNQLPYRYSFVFSFLLVALAYEAFLYIREITPKQIAAIAGGGALYIVFAQMIYQNTLNAAFAYAGLFLLFAYCGVIAVYKAGKLPESLMFFLVLMLVIGEMAGHTTSGVAAVQNSDRAGYFADNQNVRSLIAQAQKKDKGFYRMEVNEGDTLNSPMLYNYPGVSEFSSTVNSKVSYLLSHMGLEGEDAKNRYNYVLTTPVINAALNVKYLIGKGSSIDGEDSLQLIGGKETSTLYENKYPLSVGYMADFSIRNWAYTGNNPFDVLNSYVSSAANVGKPDVFHSLQAPVMSGANATLGSYQSGNVTCSPADPAAATDVQLVFNSDQAQQVYVYVASTDAATITAQRGNMAPVALQNDCGAIYSIGKCRAGDKVTIKIHYEAGMAKDITAYAYGMDMAQWDKAYRLLDDETLNVAKHTDTMLEGTIRVKKAGYFLTSVPYEKGWTLKIDGKNTAISPLCNAFIAAPIMTPGLHKVQLTYTPDGLVPGILMSLLGIAMLLLLWQISRNRWGLGEIRLFRWLSVKEKTAARPPDNRQWLPGLKQRRNL